MNDAIASTSSVTRSPWAKWLRRLAVMVAVYLLCWAITWAFAPAALNRWWAAHHGPLGRDLAGNVSPVEFRTGVAFAGEGFEYGPSPWPDATWCFCVGRPWCPAPFVVASEVAWVDGPWAGRWQGKVGPKGTMSVHAAMTAIVSNQRMSDLLKAPSHRRIGEEVS